jgi:hypothetical protein
MELVWNNSHPNRTIYRPGAWELVHGNRTSRIIPAEEIQAIADRKLNQGANKVFNNSQTLLLPYICF